MNNQYSVSVVMAVFNGEASLKNSLNSLLCQTLKGIQIIVVNDASTDGTQLYLDELSLKYSNLTIVNLKKNVGAYEARAAGIKVADAPWVGFLDADDLAELSMFEQLYCLAHKHKVDVVICGSDKYDLKHQYKSPRVRFYKDRLIKHAIFKEFCAFKLGTGALWNKLYRRELIEKWALVKHQWRQDTNEDMLINLGVFYEAKSVFVTKQSLHKYTVNAKSVTATINHQKAFLNLIKAYFLALDQFKNQNLSNVEINQITQLYKLQLNFEDYRFNDQFEQSLIDDEVKEKLIEMAQACPDNVLSLIALNEQANLPLQNRIMKKIKNLKSRLLEYKYGFVKNLKSKNHV